MSNPLLGSSPVHRDGACPVAYYLQVRWVAWSCPLPPTPQTNYETALTRAVTLVQPLVIVLWVIGVVVGALVMKSGGGMSDAIPEVLMVLVAIVGVGLVHTFDPVPAIVFYTWILAVVVVCAAGSSGPLGAVLRLAGDGTVLNTLATSDLLLGAAVESGPVYIVPAAMLMGRTSSATRC